jgi:hypothetical protein
MWVARALVVLVAMALPAGAAERYVYPDGPADLCAPEVDRALAARGMSLATMSEVAWRVDRWLDQPHLPQEFQPVSGFRFYGRPDHCVRGELILYLWPNCGISDMRTRGGCRVAGVRDGLLF